MYHIVAPLEACSRMCLICWHQYRIFSPFCCFLILISSLMIAMPQGFWSLCFSDRGSCKWQDFLAIVKMWLPSAACRFHIWHSIPIFLVAPSFLHSVSPPAMVNILSCFSGYFLCCSVSLAVWHAFTWMAYNFKYIYVISKFSPLLQFPHFQTTLPLVSFFSIFYFANSVASYLSKSTYF